MLHLFVPLVCMMRTRNLLLKMTSSVVSTLTFKRVTLSTFQISTKKFLLLAVRLKGLVLVLELLRVSRSEWILLMLFDAPSGIYRAYGILKECYSLEEKEMIELLALIKFGDALGFLKISDQKSFEKLLVEGASANLREIESFSEILKEEQVRSEYINRKIRELVSK